MAPATLLRFFSDFEIVTPKSAAASTIPSAYMYGAEPTWSDIDGHLYVERRANQVVMDWLTNWLNQPSTDERVLLISEGPATGKSTLLEARRPRSCGARPRDSPCSDARQDRYCNGPRAVCAIVSLPPSFLWTTSPITWNKFVTCWTRRSPADRVVILGAERGYRREHIDVVLSETSVARCELGDPTTNEIDQLLEKYQQSGLIANQTLVRDRRHAVRTLSGDPIAVSVCRILNGLPPIGSNHRLVVGRGQRQAKRDLPCMCVGTPLPRSGR